MHLGNSDRTKIRCHYSCGTTQTEKRIQKKCFSLKIFFENEKRAIAEMHRQQSCGASVMRVYHCSECKGFHLTSEEKIKEVNRGTFFKVKGRVQSYRGSCGVSWSLLGSPC